LGLCTGHPQWSHAARMRRDRSSKMGEIQSQLTVEGTDKSWSQAFPQENINTFRLRGLSGKNTLPENSAYGVRLRLQIIFCRDSVQKKTLQSVKKFRAPASPAPSPGRTLQLLQGSFCSLQITKELTLETIRGPPGKQGS